MALRYRQEATVSVRGPFPFDMLRYDRCFPKDSQSAADMGQSGDRHVFADPLVPSEPTTVTVVRYTETKGEAWTVGRWSSFGAVIVPGDVSKLP